MPPAPVSRLPCRLAWPTRLTRMATATLRLRPFLRARCVCCQETCVARRRARPRPLFPCAVLSHRSPWSFSRTPRRAARTAASGGGTTCSACRSRSCSAARVSGALFPLLRASSFVLFPRPSSSLSACRLLRLDALSPGTTVGPTARFASEETVYRQLRERACFDAARRTPRAQGLLAPASCAAASTAARPPRAPAPPPPAGYLLFVGCIEAKPGAEPKHACA